MAHPVSVSMEERLSSFSLTFTTVMALVLENIVGQLYCLSFLILFRLERSRF